MRFRRSLILMILLALMVFFIPACGDSGSNEGSGSVEVVDSYLDVDEETGDYTVAVIVQNNGDATVAEASLESTAYDKDGNVIKPAEDSEGTMAFYPSFGVLQPGEKGAWIEINEYSDGATIWSIYTEVPDRLEWEVTEILTGSGQEPSGLSAAGAEITASNTTDSGDIVDTLAVTLQNDSDMDYTFSNWSAPYSAGGGDLICDAVAVFRDESGKICGAAAFAPDPGTPVSIPAGGSASYDFYGTHFDGVPELYLNKHFWRN